MTKWQPIETAPKDGTEVMIWGPGFDSAYLGVNDGLVWHVADSFPHEWTEACDNPTHWMPLPQPPSE